MRATRAWATPPDCALGLGLGLVSRSGLSGTMSAGHCSAEKDRKEDEEEGEEVEEEEEEEESLFRADAVN